MITRIPIALSFTAGLAVCAAVTVLLDRPYPELAAPALVDPGQPQGAMPRSREHAAVLSWMFEHRPDTPSLEFLLWSAPSPVSENPFTNEPATLVQLVVKNRGAAEGSLEHLAFYLRNFEVLGSVNQPPDPKVKVAVCV